MKKTRMFTVLAFLVVGLAYGGTITVTQPAGGTVTMTCPAQIAWTASGITSNVRINLIRPGGALVGLIIGNQAPNSSPYSWTVGAPAVVGEQYRVRVAATDGSGVGESAVFTVVDGGGDPGDPGDPADPGTITNVHLSGSSPYCLGTNYSISWTVSAVPKQLKLQLIRSGGALVGVIVTPLAAGTSVYTWTAGNYSGGPAAADTNYKIRVATTDNSIIAESATFELKVCDGDEEEGGTIDPHIFDRLRKLRYMIKFKWPPEPDPCLCPDFDLSKLRQELGDLRGNFKLVLLKNGLKVQEFGVFGRNKAMPDSLKPRLSAEIYELLTKGGAKFSLGLVNMQGKLLNEFALEGAAPAVQLR